MTAVLVLAALAAVDPAAANLGWMTGQWRETKAGIVTEEVWGCSVDGMLFGTAVTVRGGRVAGYEQMMIQRGPGGGAVLTSAPSGQAPASFTATVSGQGRVLFANPAHDFPKAVAYALDGAVLTAAISADPSGAPAAQAWRFERVASLKCD